MAKKLTEFTVQIEKSITFQVRVKADSIQAAMEIAGALAIEDGLLTPASKEVDIAWEDDGKVTGVFN